MNFFQNSLFNKHLKAQDAFAIIFEISQTDLEIDRMAYELCGLTEEEIAIVES